MTKKYIKKRVFCCLWMLYYTDSYYCYHEQAPILRDPRTNRSISIIFLYNFFASLAYVHFLSYLCRRIWIDEFLTRDSRWIKITSCI